jgi:hypothetical protein
MGCSAIGKKYLNFCIRLYCSISNLTSQFSYKFSGVIGVVSLLVAIPWLPEDVLFLRQIFLPGYTALLLRSRVCRHRDSQY